MLAMAISLHHYICDQVSMEMMTKIKNNWLSKHWERLQQTDSPTPCQILQAYANNNNLTVADIDNQLDWNAWDLEPPDDTA